MPKVAPGPPCLKLLLLAALCGCGSPAATNLPPKVHITKVAPIAFSFPASWATNPEKHPFDLQCIAPRKDWNIGVFVYEIKDFKPGVTPSDVMQMNVDDLKSKRSNLSELEALRSYELDDKAVSTLAFAADKDGQRNCYRLSLIEFKSNKEIFAVALQVSLPESWDQAQPVFKEIVDSAEPMEVGPGPGAP